MSWGRVAAFEGLAVGLFYVFVFSLAHSCVCVCVYVCMYICIQVLSWRCISVFDGLEFVFAYNFACLYQCLKEVFRSCEGLFLHLPVFVYACILLVHSMFHELELPSWLVLYARLVVGWSCMPDLSIFVLLQNIYSQIHACRRIHAFSYTLLFI